MTSKITSYFKTLDIFGPTLSLEFDNSIKFRTICGAFLSLFIIAVILAYFFIFGREIYERNHPVINESMINREYSDINIKDIPILFSLYYRNNRINNFKDYVRISAFSYYTDQNGEPDQTNLRLKFANCNITDFDYYKNSNYTNSSGYYCVNFTNNTYMSNGALTTNSTVINFQISKCNPQRNTCAPDLEQKFKNLNLWITIIDHTLFANQANLIDSIKVNQKTQVISLLPTNYNTVYLGFSNNLLQSDEGVIYPDIRNINYRSSIFNVLTTTLAQNATNIGLLTVSSSMSGFRTTRSYMKITDLLAMIGGITNSLYFIISFCFEGMLRFKYIKFIYQCIEEVNEGKKTVIPGMNNQILINNSKPGENFNDANNNACKKDKVEQQHAKNNTNNPANVIHFVNSNISKGENLNDDSKSPVCKDISPEIVHRISNNIMNINKGFEKEFSKDGLIEEHNSKEEMRKREYYDYDSQVRENNKITIFSTNKKINLMENEGGEVADKNNCGLLKPEVKHIIEKSKFDVVREVRENNIQKNDINNNAIVNNKPSNKSVLRADLRLMDFMNSINVTPSRLNSFDNNKYSLIISKYDLLNGELNTIKPFISEVTYFKHLVNTFCCKADSKANFKKLMLISKRFMDIRVYLKKVFPESN